MSTTAATATVEVACDPGTAFDIFTRDIGAWWKRGTYYWNDAGRGLQLQFEPRAGGRLVEVYDLETGEGSRLLHGPPQVDRGQLMFLARDRRITRIGNNRLSAPSRASCCYQRHVVANHRRLIPRRGRPLLAVILSAGP